MTNARITLTFLVEDFDEFVNDWLTDGTTVQDAANLALGDQLDESMFDFIDSAIEGSQEWEIEYPAQRRANEASTLQRPLSRRPRLHPARRRAPQDAHL